MEARTIATLSMMLNAFPQSQNTDSEAEIMTYQVACEGIDDAAIIATAKAYVQGRVTGHNRSFAPSCAEFAVEARKRDADMKPAPVCLPEPKERPMNPAYRQAMGERITIWRTHVIGRGERRHKAFMRWLKRYPITVPQYLDEVAR